MLFDDAGFAEHMEMLGDLRLRKIEFLDDIGDGARPGLQELDYLETSRLGDGIQGC